VKTGDFAEMFVELTINDIRIEELTDGFPDSIIADFIERHQPGSLSPGLANHETDCLYRHGGGARAWILLKPEWEYTAG
jgi:hypothetical protein